VGHGGRTSTDGASPGATACIGFAEATLWVHEDNPRARRFYEAGGWRLDGAEKELEQFDIRVTEVRYRISLR
jgi:hypothetical protein